MVIVIPGANGLAGQQELERLGGILGQTKVLPLQWGMALSITKEGA
jgi:hypothetical protein